jgi:hypothetical protein
MKKLVLSTIVLLAFSASIILFEVSCHKTAKAQSPNYVLPVATTTKLGGVIPDGTTISVDGTGKISAVAAAPKQQNKIIYVKNLPLPGNPSLDYGQIWTANYDGSGQQQINITLPTGLFISYTPFVRLSPDQKTIFFSVSDAKNDNNGTGFFSANVDGTNPKLIIPYDGAIGTVEVAY